jgi:hypothetical protein
MPSCARQEGKTGSSFLSCGSGDRLLVSDLVLGSVSEFDDLVQKVIVLVVNLPRRKDKKSKGSDQPLSELNSGLRV